MPTVAIITMPVIKIIADICMAEYPNMTNYAPIRELTTSNINPLIIMASAILAIHSEID